MGRDGRIRDKIVITWQEIVSAWQEMAAHGKRWQHLNGMVDHNKEIRLPIAQKKALQNLFYFKNFT